MAPLGGGYLLEVPLERLPKRCPFGLRQIDELATGVPAFYLLRPRPGLVCGVKGARPRPATLPPHLGSPAPGGCFVVRRHLPHPFFVSVRHCARGLINASRTSVKVLIWRSDRNCGRTLSALDF